MGPLSRHIRVPFSPHAGRRWTLAEDLLLSKGLLTLCLLLSGPPTLRAGHVERFLDYEAIDPKSPLFPDPEREVGSSLDAWSTPVPLRTALESFGLGPGSFQCNASYWRFRQQEASNSLIPETQKLQDLSVSSKFKWPPVNISTLAGLSDFGWVETEGEGFVRAKVNSRTCTYVSVRSKDGQSFDRGSRQRAFLSALIEGGQIRMSGDITYLSARSMHLVCYRLPTVGQFLLRLRLGFTNTFEVTNCLMTKNGGGFSGYETIASSWIKVASAGAFNLTRYRSMLPLCSMSVLSESGNRGFWDGDMWYPELCRLTRLSQSSMLQCLDGKRVLMLGDSQMRLFAGLLQTYFNFSTRAEFLERYGARTFDLADAFSRLHLTGGSPDEDAGPPLNSSNGMATANQYNFLRGTTIYYGGAYQGFFVRQVSSQVNLGRRGKSAGDGVGTPGAFNMTFSSQFGVASPLFNEWKLTGTLTSGVTVTDGGTPIDLVLVANQIHDSARFDNPPQYLEVLGSKFLQELSPLLKDRGSFTMFGPLSSMESRKLSRLYRENKARQLDFERSTGEYLRQKGFPNFFDLFPLTSVREDLAFDASHYTWPVSLAMMDLWLGSYCPVPMEAT